MTDPDQPDQPMTRAQHYRQAEWLLEDAMALNGRSGSTPLVAAVLAAAQVHATLATCPYEPHPITSQEKKR